MSEIAAFQRELLDHGPLQPGEQSLAELYEEWGEQVPHFPGVDARQVPANMDYLYRAAAEEFFERQQELNFEYQKGQAQAEGLKSASNVATPADYEGRYYRETTTEEQALLDKIAAAEKNLQKYMALAEQAHAIGDYAEERSMLNLARFEREEFAEARPAYDAIIQRLEADRWERGAVDYMSMSDDQKRAFDREYPGHADECFRRVGKESPGKPLPQRTEDGRAVYFLHPDYSAQELVDRLRERAEDDPRLRVPDYQIAARAKEIDHPLMWNVTEVDGSEEQKEQVSEPEQEYGDVEVVSVDDGGRETTHFSQEDMEPQSEPDEGPKPKTALVSRI